MRANHIATYNSYLSTLIAESSKSTPNYLFFPLLMNIYIPSGSHKHCCYRFFLSTHKYVFLLGIHLNMELLVHRVNICSALVDTRKLFSEKIVSIYIPTNSV